MTAASSYIRPKSLAEALAALAAAPGSLVIAGATDVYPAWTNASAWARRPDVSVVDISAIAALRGIEDRGDHWWLGATTTWADVVAASLPPLFDGLKAAAREVGGIQIQNRGTIAGNLVTASPAGDSIPCFMALDAVVETAGRGVGTVPLAAFYSGYRKTSLAPGEIVAGIRVPKQRGTGRFLKLGARRYLVISIAMVAGVFDVDESGRIARAALAVGACSAVAQRLPALEAAIIGSVPNAGLVLPEHFNGLTPIDDVRATATYRRAAAMQLVRDMLDSLAASEGA